YSPAQAAKRGQSYFANPTLQLPGGGGGRLVYKYPDKENPAVAVYHLEAFDSYVEARFDGERWVARTDDGTEWVFGLAQYRERNPLGVTAHMATARERTLLPPLEVSRWHLTEVRNPNHPDGQRIVLDYHMMGAVDMHPEINQARVAAAVGSDSLLALHVWTQPELDSLAVFNQYPMHGPGDTIRAGDSTMVLDSPRRRAIAYRDVLLSAVTAMDGQGVVQSQAEFLYKSWRPEVELSGNPAKLAKARLLLLSDPQVVRRDSLWSQRVVWFRGTDRMEARTLHAWNRPAVQNPQPFEGGWRRYMHPRAHQNPLAPFNFQIDSRNPYKFHATGVTGVVDGWYMSRTLATASPNASAATLPFTHSVLESPRIDLAAIPGGDLYELRTLVKSPDQNIGNPDMNLDFRVVTGLVQANAIQGGPAAHCPHVLVGAMDWQLAADQLSGPLGYWETGHAIHSTNRDVIKWNPALAGHGVYTATATPFRLPNLPNEFGGFAVQVGPGSSDMAHSITDASGNGYPAFYTGRNSTGAHRDSFELQFGQWFGTGAPLEPHWRTDGLGIDGDQLQWRKNAGQMRRYFWHLNNGWTYNPTQLQANGPNQPTAVTWEDLAPQLTGSYSFNPNTMPSAHTAPRDAELVSVELLRIARNPWMLDEVRLLGPGGTTGGGILVAAWKLDYDLALAPVPNN
ncbi:MAG TPA: hypothetical protein PKW90_12200, partial [Myxococcota bacterium]|nr:hypothetical protein [Myxococcota bacterium]